jgi:hypothetical protein
MQTPARRASGVGARFHSALLPESTPTTSACASIFRCAQNRVPWLAPSSYGLMVTPCGATLRPLACFAGQRPSLTAEVVGLDEPDAIAPVTFFQSFLSRALE